MQTCFLGRPHGVQILAGDPGRDGADMPAGERGASRHRRSGYLADSGGRSKVRVRKCGEGICGVIVWLKDPISPATGKPQVDDKNPNPALAMRPMIGLALFTGMRPSGPNQWSGRIYNADDGSTYASSVSVSGSGMLRVEGCVGALCGGENWTRSSR